ncbi:hypothetical protein [Streptomyces ardesiacus]|uniref:hypothetical protein n=1 Tax=Streptomyces ardesiacus TaxID=285564 RepID=UPI0036CA8A73
MKKATLVEAGILVTFGGAATSLATQMNAHDVPTLAIIAVIAFTITTGASLAQTVGQGLRTTFFACPTKGCTVSIRAKNTSPADLDRLHTLATDHSKHGATR